MAEKIKNIELLSPAKTAEIGIEAIRHGADAVYIGAPKFGARSAASNTIEELQTLIDYAHLFHAKVYITFNTILKDEELAEAEQLIKRLYEIGVDALIVQDMAIFEMDLPPIAIHASTQTDNRTLEKVKFFESIGCSQVVLARESSLEQIKNISSNTNVALEAFVHGALCVSYSGQCYASQALCGRSANRGNCAQICRLPFDLQDSEGHSFGKYHWLSLKDLDLSASLEEMIEAGISSFKIEGRLKDADYVKNITAYYRQKLDDILKKHSSWHRTSDGYCNYTFVPNVCKTFHRDATDYFYHGRHNGIVSLYTPKSTGEFIGTVIYSDSKSMSLDTKVVLHNGDGLCYLDDKNQFQGFRVNRVEGKMLFPAESLVLKKGTQVYRNADIEYERILSKPSAIRKIPIKIALRDNILSASDGVNNATVIISQEKIIAQKPQDENIRFQLSKLGDTIYESSDIEINSNWFFPSSILSDARRRMVIELNKLRIETHPKTQAFIKKNDVQFPKTELDYTGNVYNHLAEAFYKRHGVFSLQRAFEQNAQQNLTLMFCKHCIKYTLGACLNHPNPDVPMLKTPLQEPLHLIYKNYYLRLQFDCKNCEMHVIAE